MVEDPLAERIIKCALNVQEALGPGLVESAYRNGMYTELKKDSLAVEVEKYIPLIYNGMRTRKAYRVDLLVQNKIVVEIKAAKRIHYLDEAQVQTYLKILQLKNGLIFNFNVSWLKNGIRRATNRDYR